MHDMMTTTTMPSVANNDAELVIASLSGDRDAFGQIVSRYQSLICSLTYSATGSLGESEDLAQGTFITAWKHLRHLREAAKLRARARFGRIYSCDLLATTCEKASAPIQ